MRPGSGRSCGSRKIVRANHGNEAVRHLVEAAERASLGFRVTTTLVLLAAITFADWFTGYEFSFASVYLMPIVIAAWFIGANYARVLSLASAAIWFSVNYPAERASTLAINEWNIAIRLLTYLFVAMLVGTARDLLESERRRSRIDDLTGSLNSRAFYELVTREVDRMRRTTRPLSLAYIDLDDFKSMNDRFGHAAGDELLRTFARCTAQTVRATDTVARLGGDEFGILMPETDTDGAIAAIARFRERICSVNDAPIAFSMGVITCEDPEVASADALLARADTLMYTAKRLGKNRYLHSRFSQAADILPPAPARTADKR